MMVAALTALTGCAAQRPATGTAESPATGIAESPPGAARETGERTAGETSTSVHSSPTEHSSGGPRPTQSSLPTLVLDTVWVSRQGQRALQVTPADYLRAHRDQDVADEAWRRVVSALPAADSPGMRDQFVCHVVFAADKSAWFLEPERPAVGYAATVLAGCNPGTQRDVG